MPPRKIGTESRLAALFLVAAALVQARAGEIDVYGHRGARARFPPNTWPAFEHALLVGTDVLELDVAATRDDRLVVTHDLTLEPEHCRRADGSALPGSLRIRELTLAEARQILCGGRADPAFPEQRVMEPSTPLTLEELLDRVRSSGLPGSAAARFSIEAKTHWLDRRLSPDPARMADLLVDVIRSRLPLDRVIIQSFDRRTLRAVEKLEPTLKTAWLKKLPVTPFTRHFAERAGADVVSPKTRWVSRKTVERLHKAGLEVIPWTPNSAKEWDKLIEAGVDGIITDDPERLIERLRELGRR